MRSTPLELAAAGLLIAIVALTAALYEGGTRGPLLLDDYPHLLGFVKGGIVGEGDWAGRLLSESGPLKRPVAMATFAFNAVTNGADFSRWKHTNVMIHLAVGLLATWFGARVMLLLEGVPRRRAWMLGTIVGGLWLLHPLHVSTVLYAVQRMTQLSALFTLAGLLMYIDGRCRLDEKRPYGRAFIVAAFAVFMPLATLSKESGALFPMFCLLLEALFFRRRGASDRRFLVVCYVLFLVLPAVAGGYYVFEHLSERLANTYLARGFTPYERLLTEARVLVSYLLLLLVPVQRRMGFYHDDLEVSTGWLQPPPTLAALFLIAFVLWTTWRFRKRQPVYSFGVLFFFAGHLLESTVLPLELMFEHRNYLPSVGIVLALVAGVGAGLHHRLKVILAAAAIAILAGVTFLRVDTWSSPRKMYEYMYRAHPQSDGAASAYAEWLAKSGRPKEAYRLLSGRASPGAVMQAMYLQCRMTRRLDPAAFENATRRLGTTTGMYVATALMEIGRNGLDAHCDFPGESYLALVDKALQGRFVQNVVRYKLMFYRAHYQWKLKRGDEAVTTLEEAHRLYPQDPMSLFLAAEWLTDLGRPREARNAYERAVKVASAAPLDYSEFIETVGKMVNEGDAHSGGFGAQEHHG